jgi:hypothetical protein
MPGVALEEAHPRRPLVVVHREIEIEELRTCLPRTLLDPSRVLVSLREPPGELLADAKNEVDVARARAWRSRSSR